jgi:spermidine synthase
MIYIFFFVSGATSLVYEAVWLRMLGLVFGHSVYAITTVLAAFMAGLALGSLLFGRLATRLGNRIGAYGVLEISIGISCALLPAGLWVAAKVYLKLHTALSLSYDTFGLVQFLLVFAVLLLPTTLMGGTLPVLSQALATVPSDVGRQVGALYAVNTFGAVAGVTVAGYLFLPLLGNSLTLVVAVAANLAVGLMALAYSRRAESLKGRAAAVESAIAAVSPPRSMPSAASSDVRGGVIALAISGAVSMIYEVCWTRALALVIGSSTYAFTAMLISFLIGIAGGSAIYSWWRGTARPSLTTLAALQAAIAVATTVAFLFFDHMPVLFLNAFRWSENPSFIRLAQLLISAISLLPFTLLIGAAFPCTVAIATREPADIGRDVGNVYAVNTLGAIVGTLLTGLVLIPTLGVTGSIKVGIATNLTVAAALLTLATVGRPTKRKVVWRWPVIAVTVCAAAAALVLPAWNQGVLSSGPAIYAQKYVTARRGVDFDTMLRDQKVVFYRDGRTATVSVHHVGQNFFLRVNGKTDAGTSQDMATQLMLGHLPMLLHPNAQQVLVIGLGSGVTAGAVLRHPVGRVDTVEIEPAVIEASRFFAKAHGDVLHDPRSTVIVADARNYLLTTSARYDAIVSEPSNPWIGGLASLFSREFFRLAHDHLRPGGLMVQWLQGYNLAPEDLRMVVNTFRSAFPYVTVWNTLVGGDYLLVGSVAPQEIDLGALKTRVEKYSGVRDDLRRAGLEGWAGALGYFVLGNDDVTRLAAGIPLNDDDRLPLEFSAPLALYRDTSGMNWDLVRRFRTAELPRLTVSSAPELERADTWSSIATGHVSRNDLQEALRCFEKALVLDPQNARVLVSAGAIHLRLGQVPVALALAQKAIRQEPSDGQALYLAGMAAQALFRVDEAAAFFDRAVKAQPGNAAFRAARDRAVTAAALR